MSNLIINETPFQFLPSLAAKIGVDEALILQQVHYFINPDYKKDKKLIEGKYWVYNTYSEWHQMFKGCWSEPTLKRIFLKLEKLKLLIVGRFNKNKDDRTKWYTIDYETLKCLEVGTTDQIDPRINLIPSMGSKRSQASDQIDPLYKEQENTYQKITQENKNTRTREVCFSEEQDFNNERELTLQEKISFVFDHWRKVMNHPNAKLDPKRHSVILAALKLGYHTDDICKAIDGCSLTPFNMGENETGRPYNDIHVILKGAAQVERFIHNALNPAKPVLSSRELLVQQAEKEREERDARIKARSMARAAVGA